MMVTDGRGKTLFNLCPTSGERKGRPAIVLLQQEGGYGQMKEEALYSDQLSTDDCSNPVCDGEGIDCYVPLPEERVEHCM